MSDKPGAKGRFSRPDPIPLRTPETRYYVAPWWPNEGYGGGSGHATEEEAMAAHADLIRKGFEHVRVWKVTTEWIIR